MCGGCRPAVKRLIEEETAAAITSTPAPSAVAAS
jgi:hypothetical protein